MGTVWRLLGLFAAAVAVALLAVNNDGTVSIFLPHRRIDLSLNLALLGLFALFVLLHITLVGLRQLFALPAQSRQWRSLQRERGAHAALLDAWIYWRSGRYVRAREAAKLALQREKAMCDAGEHLQHGAAMQALAHTLLAESAYALREPDEREAQLQEGLAVSRHQGGSHLLAETQQGLLLRAAQWALAERNPQQAVRLLHGLSRGARRRTAALRLLAQAAEQDGRPLEAFELTRLLRQHGDLSDEAALRVLLPLAEAAAVQTTSIKGLRAIWQQLAKWRTRGTRPEVSGAVDAQAAQERESLLRLPTALRLIDRATELPQGTAQAHVWMQEAWDLVTTHAPTLDAACWAQVVGTLEHLLVALNGQPEYEQWLDRLVHAHAQQPTEPTLQYLAGMAALSRSQWDEARQRLAQAVVAQPQPRLQRQAWRALARLAEAQGRHDEAHQAWQQAAMVD